MLKRFFVVLLFLAVIIGVIGGLKYQQFQQMQAQLSQPQPPATVASAQASHASWVRSLRSVGSLVAVNGVSVSSEVAGTVSRIAFESGQRVSEGDLLLQLDDTVDRATLAGLKADRRLAEVQLERARNLLERKAISKSEFDEAKAKYDAAEARVEEQREIINKKSIRAPFDGLLGIRRVDVGEYLQPGSQIVSLQALDPIYVDYSLPERHFSRIAVGQTIEVRLDVYPDEVFNGRIIALDSGVDEGTRSIGIRATLANDGRLRPGMFAEVLTLEEGAQQVLTIPRTAVSFNTYGDFVFRIVEGDEGSLKVARTQIETGDVRAGRVAVTKGLEAGDRVVAAGQVKLRDGQAVKIDDSVELDPEVSGE